MTFPVPRPKGKDMPSATPRGRARSKAPMQGAIPPPTKSMDSTGRFTICMSPRTTGGITIESREQSAASVAKRARISKGGTK